MEQSTDSAPLRHGPIKENYNMAGQASGKPPDPTCPMCGSMLAKSQAGLHVMSKVQQSMGQKLAAKNVPQPRQGPGMSAPMGPTGPTGPRRF